MLLILILLKNLTINANVLKKNYLILLFQIFFFLILIIFFQKKLDFNIYFSNIDINNYNIFNTFNK